MRRLRLPLLFIFFLGSLTAAHGTDRHLDDQLVEKGERLLVGTFDAPQPGPLLVVPYVEGPLPCGPRANGFLVPLGDDVGVTLLANATHLVAAFELPAPGYAALAVDTHDAVRALILMREQAVSLHRLAALVAYAEVNGSVPFEVRAGLLGIPYELPGASMHNLGHPLEGEGIAMSYDRETGPATGCDEAGHVALVLERALVPSLETGRVVHAIVLYERTVTAFLPHPLDATQVFQANLYLARPGEDPAMLRAAFDPHATAFEVVPWAGVLLGVAWAGRWRP